MNKADLLLHVAAETSTTRAAADRMAGAAFSAITDALACDESVAIAGLGQFAVQASPRKHVHPKKIYGDESEDASIVADLEPWAGKTSNPLPPWEPPVDPQNAKNSKHPTVVEPPSYDATVVHHGANEIQDG